MNNATNSLTVDAVFLRGQTLAAVAPDCADWARVCAPSVAVAQLAANPGTDSPCRS